MTAIAFKAFFLLGSVVFLRESWLIFIGADSIRDCVMATLAAASGLSLAYFTLFVLPRTRCRLHLDKRRKASGSVIREGEANEYRNAGESL